MKSGSSVNSPQTLIKLKLGGHRDMSPAPKVTRASERARVAAQQQHLESIELNRNADGLERSGELEMKSTASQLRNVDLVMPSPFLQQPLFLSTGLPSSLSLLSQEGMYKPTVEKNCILFHLHCLTVVFSPHVQKPHFYKA